jgi:hypothetical protein
MVSPPLERGIDRRRRLAVVLAVKVRVGRERDRWRRVAEPACEAAMAALAKSCRTDKLMSDVRRT